MRVSLSVIFSSSYCPQEPEVGTKGAFLLLQSIAPTETLSHKQLHTSQHPAHPSSCLLGASSLDTFLRKCEALKGVTQARGAGFPGGVQKLGVWQVGLHFFSVVSGHAEAAAWFHA